MKIYRNRFFMLLSSFRFALVGLVVMGLASPNPSWAVDGYKTPAKDLKRKSGVLAPSSALPPSSSLSSILPPNKKQVLDDRSTINAEDKNKETSDLTESDESEVGNHQNQSEQELSDVNKNEPMNRV